MKNADILIFYLNNFTQYNLKFYLSRYYFICSNIHPRCDSSFAIGWLKIGDCRGSGTETLQENQKHTPHQECAMPRRSIQPNFQQTISFAKRLAFQA